MRRADASVGVVLLAAALAGCGSTPFAPPEPVTTVRVVQTMAYPELPDIQLPIEPALLPWEYEVPRDLSRTEPKATPECQRVPEKERDEAYLERCGEHPVIRDTNVLFGFDQRNWNLLLSNFSKLREYIFQLKARIDLANDSRREWRTRAEEERRKAAAAGAKPGAAPAPEGRWRIATAARPAARVQQPDLAVEPDLEPEGRNRERHARRKRLGVDAGSDGLGHRLLDLALRVDADRLEEFADALVECVVVHRCLQAGAGPD
jgi:hypothetical protein